MWHGGVQEREPSEVPLSLPAGWPRHLRLLLCDMFAPERLMGTATAVVEADEQEHRESPVVVRAPSPPE